MSRLTYDWEQDTEDPVWIVTGDGETMRLYLDGEEVASAPISGTSSGSAAHDLGSWEYVNIGGGNWEGQSGAYAISPETWNTDERETTRQWARGHVSE